MNWTSICGNIRFENLVGDHDGTTATVTCLQDPPPPFVYVVSSFLKEKNLDKYISPWFTGYRHVYIYVYTSVLISDEVRKDANISY